MLRIELVFEEGEDVVVIISVIEIFLEEEWEELRREFVKVEEEI